MPKTAELDIPLLNDPAGLGLRGSGQLGSLGALGNSLGASTQSTPFFGSVEIGSGLEGTFYDLKQRQTRTPTDLTDAQYFDQLRSFDAESWRTSALQNYYKAPQKMYAAQFLVPCIPATEAPKAFQVEKEVQPSRWVIHYKGKVTAPETGTYRFVGGSDDVLAVRFNAQVVLDGSLRPFTEAWREQEPGAYHYRFGGGSAVRYKGMLQGAWFKVQKGMVYPIEVLLGEQPGGGFFAQLLVEQQGAAYEKDGLGNPILPLFRVREISTPQQRSLTLFANEGPVWTLAPSSP